MVFSEATFLFLFLPVVLLLYALVPQGWRNGLLTIASLLFYAAGEASFLPLLLGSIVLNYYFALWIARQRGHWPATALLALGIASDLALLAYFKYTNFFLGSWDAVHGLFAPAQHAFKPLKIVLPLGISFFTFHKISYKVDVFRGHAEAKRSFFDLALYILFFPQLIAGPIVRYNEIAGQLGGHQRTLDWERFGRGARVFIIGLSKKMLIANVLAFPADRIFGLPPQELTCSVAWLGLACYTLQIYFDFSGYSDMAVGLACFFGFDFPANFNYPYWSQSVTEFWRRWHISLSAWFRDYLYIPLGGNRGTPARTYCNLFLVFLLCGLWHGASWSFVLWGVFHGSFLIAERAFLGGILSRAPRLVRHGYLLLVVMTGWVFFRADTLPQARHYLASLAGFGTGTAGAFYQALYVNPHAVYALLVGALAATPLWRAFSSWPVFRPAAWETGGLAVCLLLSLLAVITGTYNPFIYYRF